MNYLSPDEQYDEYVGERQRHHIAVMHAKLRAAEPLTVGLVDDALGAKLADSEAWSALIVATARGEKALDALICKAVEEMAEVEALKDAEKAEQSRKDSIAEYKFDMNKMVENMIKRSGIFHV